MTATTAIPTTHPGPATGLDDRARRTARGTGLAYLGIIATGLFAELAVRGTLVVADDPAATATNIAAAPTLFGIGIGADVVMVALDVVVAVGLWRLLRHVDRRLALTATVLRLVQGAVIAVNLLALVQALGSARDAIGTDGTVLAGPAGDALDAIERHALGYDVGLIAFAGSCLVLSRLLWASGLVPRWIAGGMAATGAVYLLGSAAALVVPALSPVIDPLYVIPVVVELAFAVRLVRGLPPTRTTTARPTPATA